MTSAARGAAPDVNLRTQGINNRVVVGGMLAVAGVYYLSQGERPGEEGDGEEEIDRLWWLWILLWIGWRSAQFMLFIFLMLLVLLVVRQRFFLYVPVPPGTTRSPKNNPAMMRSPACWNLPFEDVWVTTPDKVKIHGWLIYQPASSCGSQIPYTFIYFHGNAGNIGHRLENIKDMHERLGINIFIIDYRGYGDSQDGTGPNEVGFAADAMAAYRWLAARAADPPPTMRLSTERLMIFGRSIGGAVGIRLAADLLRERLRSTGDSPDSIPLPSGMVLENTFTCLRDIAVEVFPFLSFLKPLLRPPLIFDEWRSMDQIDFLCQHDENWCCCLLSGLQDKIVPPEQMRALHTILKKRRPQVLKMFVFHNGGHNDTPTRGGAEYWASFKKFMDAVVASEGDRRTGRQALG